MISDEQLHHPHFHDQVHDRVHGNVHVPVHDREVHVNVPFVIEDTKGYLKSKGGATLLVDQRDYTYFSNRTTEDRVKKYWVCSSRNKLKCTARIVSTNHKVTRISGNHNHPPDFQCKLQDFQHYSFVYE